MPRRRPFRSPCTGPSGRKPRRGQSSFRRGVLRRRSDRWDPESAEFCSRSPILMVARTKRNDAHETPRHALPGLGCPVGARSAPLARGHRGGSREGDSHHLDEESCDGGQTGGIPNLQNFAADHRSSWSRGQNETTPMKRPRHTLPGLGCPVGARSAPLARGHRA